MTPNVALQEAPAPPRYRRAQLGRMTEAQVAGIEARVRFHALPWWRRLVTRRPQGWQW